MKPIRIQVLLSTLLAACAYADTPLTVTSDSPYVCLQNAYPFPTPIEAIGSFSLNGVTGVGILKSSVTASAPTFSYPPEIYFFNYSIDLSQLSAAPNHCIKLLIHFGTPQGCAYQEVFGDPTSIESATLAPFGDITFVFANGCLSPGQAAVSFLMYSEAAPKTNIVTIIDDYVDAASGTTNETRIKVPAIVPDIPPNPPPWVYFHPIKFPYPFLQGTLTFPTNYYPPPSNSIAASVPYDFTLQLVNAQSNGLAASEVVTQTVQVVNGLFNLPLPFAPISMGDGSVRWLRIGVRPSGLPAVQFTPLDPPLPITPAPQAFYAYTAGAVADLAPGQAVTSLNGLTDAVNLQAGPGIVLGTNGSTLTITAQPGVVSDRNAKTDFAPVKPTAVLAGLARLPIQSWRYTNEPPGTRHLGPMAQDFRRTFGLGSDDKFIGFVDEQGVALTAIQALNQKLDDLQKELNLKEAENAELKARLDLLEQSVAHSKSN